MTTPVRRVPRLVAVVLTAALALSGAVSGTAVMASADAVFSVSGTVLGKSAEALEAAPLEGIRVTLVALDSAGDPTAVQEVSTSATGAFTLTPGTAGEYSLVANCSDGPFCDLGYPVDYLGNSSDGAHAERFTISEGSPNIERNITLQGGSQVSGTVLDETGAPAAGAEVRANRPGQAPAASTTTDTSGQFVLTRVPAGAIVVSTEYTPQVDQQYLRFYEQTFYPGTTVPADATSLAVAAGSDNPGTDITLVPEPSVRLHAVDDDGDPISGISFLAYALDPQTGNYESVPGGGSSGTDADGWLASPTNAGTYTYLVQDFRLPGVDDPANPQGRVSNFDSEWFDDALARQDATPVSIGPVSIGPGTTGQATLEVELAEHSGAPAALGSLTIGEAAEAPGTLVRTGDFWLQPASASSTSQWLRDGVPIDGATADSYPLTADDAGTDITLRITASLDPAGETSGETAIATFESPPFEVHGLPFDETPAPTISGSVSNGSVLTADPKTWTPAPTSRTYQWLRDGEVIEGATGLTYLLDADDVGARISFKTTGRLAGHSRTTVVSDPTAPVLDVLTAPTSIPAPDGESTVGETLTAVTGSWSPQPDSYEYQWLRKTGDGSFVAIDDARGATYTLTAADAGKAIAVEIVAVKAGFAEPSAVRSEATAVVLDEFVPPGTIPPPMGALHVGQALTADTGTWTPDADSFDYQWVRKSSLEPTGFVAIDGATMPTYALTTIDQGKNIAVRITAVKEGFATSDVVLSTATPAVSAALGMPGQEGEPVVPLRFGTKLVAPTVSWSRDPAAVTYQWVRKTGQNNIGFTVIDGAVGPAYNPGQADLGKYIAVRIFATAQGSTTSVAISAGSTKVTAYEFSTRGTPTVSGQAVFGRVLTASAGTWLPTPDSISYRWMRGNVEIPGATNALYTLGVDDIGEIISVKAYGVKMGYEDVRGMTSANTTSTVVPASFTGVPPAVNGGAYVEQVLTVDPGVIVPEPASVTYEWLRGSEVVQSDAEPYAITTADLGESITFRVRAARSGYTNIERSDSTAVVQASPVFTKVGTPSISGTAKVGSRLTAVRGTWTGSSAVTIDYAYQWSANGAEIDGATSSTYLLLPAQRGKTVTVRVTAALQYGETRTSAASKTTAAVAYGTVTAKTPTISGTVRSGKTLTANTGSWAPTGLSFTYQWLRDGKSISGARSKTYVLTGSDYKKKISVTVTGAKTAYKASSKTSAKKTVAIGYLTAPTPTVSGTIAVGSKVTAKATWGPATVTKKYQWYANGKKISGATKSTYTIASSLKGKKLTVTVTGKKTGFISVAKKSAARTIAARG